MTQQRPIGGDPIRLNARGTASSVSPARRFLSGWQPWGIGTFGLGIVLIIVAIVLHDHNAYPNAVCHTGLGELGQAFSGSAYYQCSAAATAEGAVGPLVFFGVLALVVGGGKMAFALAAAVARAKPAGPAGGDDAR